MKGPEPAVSFDIHISIARFRSNLYEFGVGSSCSCCPAGFRPDRPLGDTPGPVGTSSTYDFLPELPG